MEPISAVLVAISTVSAAFAAILGGFDFLLKSLLILMAVDILTGLTVAGYYKKSSKTKTGRFALPVFTRGLVQKFLCLAVIVVAGVADAVIGVDIARDVCCIFYIAEEGLSVLENAKKMDVPLPKALTEVLEVIQDQVDCEQLDDIEYRTNKKAKKERRKAKRDK